MVRQKPFSEIEQLMILRSVLINKAILENPARNSRDPALRQKWDEIAAEIDTIFGTERGAEKIRAHYQRAKYNAKKKFNSMVIPAGMKQIFDATLSAPERILREICPTIFPTIIPDVDDANAGETSTREADGSFEREHGNNAEGENTAILQLLLSTPGNSKNSQKNTTNAMQYAEPNASETGEEAIDQATEAGAENAVVIAEDNDMEELALSLRSMIDIQMLVANPANEDHVAEFEKVFHTLSDIDFSREVDIGTVEVAVDVVMNNEPRPSATIEMPSQNEPLDLSKDEVSGKKGKQSKARGQSVTSNESESNSYTDGTPAKKQGEEAMETETTDSTSNGKLVEENSDNSTEPAEADISIAKATKKRGKVQRAKNAKKRKLGISATAEV